MKPTRVTSTASDKEFLCMTAQELARVLSNVVFAPEGSETRIEDLEHGVTWVITVRREK